MIFLKVQRICNGKFECYGLERAIKRWTGHHCVKVKLFENKLPMVYRNLFCS